MEAGSAGGKPVSTDLPAEIAPASGDPMPASMMEHLAELQIQEERLQALIEAKQKLVDGLTKDPHASGTFAEQVRERALDVVQNAPGIRAPEDQIQKLEAQLKGALEAVHQQGRDILNRYAALGHALSARNIWNEWEYFHPVIEETSADEEATYLIAGLILKEQSQLRPSLAKVIRVVKALERVFSRDPDANVTLAFHGFDLPKNTPAKALQPWELFLMEMFRGDIADELLRLMNVLDPHYLSEIPAGISDKEADNRRQLNSLFVEFLEALQEMGTDDWKEFFSYYEHVLESVRTVRAETVEQRAQARLLWRDYLGIKASLLSLESERALLLAGIQADEETSLRRLKVLSEARSELAKLHNLLLEVQNRRLKHVAQFYARLNESVGISICESELMKK